MAIYEYNGAIDELDVTPGQAHQYDEYLDRWDAMRRQNAEIQVNDMFKIEPDKGMYSPCYKQMVEYLTIGGSSIRECWYYFYSKPGRGRIQFATIEEAIEFIEAYMSLLQWMGDIIASTPVIEETYEDLLAAQYQSLKGDVIYYTEVIDQSERVARLLEVSRSGVLLADPADPHDLGCWYSFNQVIKIQRGRQWGWR